jgi:hypothetical protein
MGMLHEGKIEHCIVQSDLSLQPPPNNDHFSTATKILGSYFHFLNLPLNNDRLSITATNFGSRVWSLYTGLTDI